MPTKMSENKPERLTLNNWEKTRADLVSLREESGQSPAVLRQADRLEGRLHEEVVDFIWEHYLIGKHMIMDARKKSGLIYLPEKVIEMAEGYRLMRSSAFRAQKYINENHVDTKRPRSGRFLGEVEMLIGNHKKAAEYFGRSVSLFNKMEDPSERVNALELSGFWVESLILGGKVKEGIEVAKETFKNYDQDDGLNLKNRDYYTWAVWKSGCAIKVWHALLYKKVSVAGENRENLIEMLREAERIVNPSPETKIWGDFTRRREEIASIKGRLKLD